MDVQLLLSKSKAFISIILKNLRTNFQMKRLILNSIVSMEMNKTSHGLIVNQINYIEYLVNKCYKSDAKGCRTPADVNVPLSKN